MGSFKDVYLPDSILAYEFSALPRTNTTIVTASNGSEQRTRNTLHPLRRFNSPAGVQCNEDIQDLYEHWLVMGGPFNSFPMRDPLDFASRRVDPDVVPTVLGIDQVLGVGDGFNRVFQLQKTYTRGGLIYTRPIHLPILSSVKVLINALDPSTGNVSLPGGPYTFDVTRYGGAVTFDHAPHTGEVVTAGFLFDNEVRFEADDSFTLIEKAFRVSGFSSLDFMELRFCNDGDEI